VKATSVDGKVRGLGSPRINVREMLVTTPTILVEQDETDENGAPRLNFPDRSHASQGAMGLAGGTSLIALERVF
jgi:hypothetical protein